MSMARLSSARHINSASADAAGIVIASRLKSEIREKDQAIRNALDGQTLMDTAEGAQKEIENILHRIRGNLVQSASLQVFRTKALTTVAQLMDDIPAGGQARVEPPPQRISTPRSSRWVAKE
jgi:flagellin-like hook-associated protein FlgL